MVEHIARANDVARSPTHRELRQTFSANAMARLKIWLDTPRPHWLPDEPPGKAVSYMVKNWAAMTVFLERVDVPVDNNASDVSSSPKPPQSGETRRHRHFAASAARRLTGSLPSNRSQSAGCGLCG